MVARYCDRIIMLRDRRIFCEGAPEDVLTPENMRAVFNVDAELVKDLKTGRNTVLLHGSARRVRNMVRSITNFIVGNAGQARLTILPASIL